MKHSGYYAWYAFDGTNSTCSLSNEYEANNYYVEYDFSREVYALKIKFNLNLRDVDSGWLYGELRDIDLIVVDE